MDLTPLCRSAVLYWQLYLAARVYWPTWHRLDVFESASGALDRTHNIPRPDSNRQLHNILFNDDYMVAAYGPYAVSAAEENGYEMS